jgi:hypothetical protein
MPPGALPRESARSLLADAHSALTQRRYRLCLLTLVLTMTLCWEALYPAPGTTTLPSKGGSSTRRQACHAQAQWCHPSLGEGGFQPIAHTALP